MICLMRLNSILFETYVPISVNLPYQEGQLISLFHEQGQVEKIEHVRGGVFIQGLIPGRLMAQFQLYARREKDDHPRE